MSTLWFIQIECKPWTVALEKVLLIPKVSPLLSPSILHNMPSVFLLRPSGTFFCDVEVVARRSGLLYIIFHRKKLRKPLFIAEQRNIHVQRVFYSYLLRKYIGHSNRSVYKFLVNFKNQFIPCRLAYIKNEARLQKSC